MRSEKTSWKKSLNLSLTRSQRLRKQNIRNLTLTLHQHQTSKNLNPSEPVRTAVQDDPDDPDDEDPSSSTDEEKTSRPKRASGRGRPEKTSTKTKKEEKEYTGSRLFKHAEKLQKFKGRDDESFSVWLGKYEMMMFTLYEQSKKTAYDCLEIALEEEAHSSWKNWALENPEEEPKNSKTFKKWT